MAFQWQQQAGDPRRTRFARFEHAYHGDTLGAVSVGGIDIFHQVYGPLLFDTVALPTPLHPDPATEAMLLDSALATLEAAGDTLAAIIVEPLVQGAAGMRMHSSGYLNAILAKAKEVGALVILDEVATGFGRTGTLFAAEQLSVAPDLMCLGKGLSNGYLPLAATLASDRIFQGFVGSPRNTFFHGHTFTGNPLACAAGVACLELFEEERTIERVARRAIQLERGLSEFLDHPHVAAIRQQGLMIGLDLCQASGASYDPALRTGARFCAGLRSPGCSTPSAGRYGCTYAAAVHLSGADRAAPGNAWLGPEELASGKVTRKVRKEKVACVAVPVRNVIRSTSTIRRSDAAHIARPIWGGWRGPSPRRGYLRIRGV